MQARINHCQGGVLSPLVWTALVTLNQGPYHVQGYEDNIALVVQGKFQGALTDLMNGVLRLINDWCSFHSRVGGKA